jgi:hypothetical protein
MSVFNTEYYGDDFRWFVGTVIDNTPPTGLEGRLQVRIHGIHSREINDIPQKDLPWAQVMSPSDTFGGSGFGTHCQILPGSLVFGMFLDGQHSQLPMVLGSLPRIEYPSAVQSSARQDISTNPFAYKFAQTNSQLQDPVFYRETETDNTNPLSVYDVTGFFIDNGLTAKQASSITGVLQEISGLNPKQETNGYGIAGWQQDTPRFFRFLSFIKRLSPTRTFEDFDGQLLYVLQELQTTKSSAYAKMLRSKSIKSSDGRIGYVEILVKEFVFPLTVCQKSSAENKAEQIYKALGGR